MVDSSRSNRAKRVRSLMKNKRSDIERWSRQDQLKTWSERTRRAAKFVRKGTSVLDLGCGNMSLRDALPEGCVYIPADIVKRSENCRVIELNQGNWPDEKVDVVAALGVLEYLYDMPAFFLGSSKIGPRLIFSYHVTYVHTPESEDARLNMGWLNNFSLPEIIEAIVKVGGKVDRVDGFVHKKNFTQYLFVISFPRQAA